MKSEAAAEGRPARLVMALHFHQPVGNFDTVFRDAVRLSYRPLLEHFERHPGVRAAFHLSGCLIEWLEDHDVPLLDQVLALVASGRVEPLGGGFYEPILPSIPREDALDQMERLSDWWRRRAGIAPRGAWIAERVWEPSLAELLAEAGVEYTILDDQHLRFAGLLDPRFSGVFVTERSARPIAFFPSDSALRYLLPFRPIETVREHLTQAAGLTLTYGDDAEKFGLWPETHAWVYGEGWLEKFFSLLEEPGGPARAVLPREVLDERPEARKVYIPNASYMEMLEWALPAASVAAYGATRAAAQKGGGEEAVRAFVRGSLWDMFLARYPEADQLHKHVLWTSRRARALRRNAARRGPAITAALRAECNCAYWHGLFGGVYYNHLRHGLYNSLLTADALLAETDRRPVVVEEIDFDGDREDEVILRAGGLQAFCRPSDGGTLVELDWLPARFNVTNVMSRWRESYHEGADQTHGEAEEGAVASPHEQQVAVSAADLEGRTFDILPLRSLRDFVTDRAPDPGNLEAFPGLRLVSGRPEARRARDDGFEVRLRQEGVAWRKTVGIDPRGILTVRWKFETPPAAGFFGTLLCLSLLTPRDPDRSLRLVRAGGEAIEAAPGDRLAADGVERLTLEDHVFRFALEVRIRPAGRVVSAPIETLQRAEVRYESAYQGTLFALCWPARGGDGGGSAVAPEIQMSFRESVR
jgi:alpha-amylase